MFGPHPHRFDKAYLHGWLRRQRLWGRFHLHICSESTKDREGCWAVDVRLNLKLQRCWRQVWSRPACFLPADHLISSAPLNSSHAGGQRLPLLFWLLLSPTVLIKPFRGSGESEFCVRGPGFSGCFDEFVRRRRSVSSQVDSCRVRDVLAERCSDAIHLFVSLPSDFCVSSLWIFLLAVYAACVLLYSSQRQQLHQSREVIGQNTKENVLWCARLPRGDGFRLSGNVLLFWEKWTQIETKQTWRFNKWEDSSCRCRLCRTITSPKKQ